MYTGHIHSSESRLWPDRLRSHSLHRKTPLSGGSGPLHPFSDLSCRDTIRRFKALLLMTLSIVVSTMVSQAFFYCFEPRAPLLTILSKQVAFLGPLTCGINIYTGRASSMAWLSHSGLSPPRSRRPR